MPTKSPRFGQKGSIKSSEIYLVVNQGGLIPKNGCTYQNGVCIDKTAALLVDYF